MVNRQIWGAIGSLIAFTGSVAAQSDWAGPYVGVSVGYSAGTATRMQGASLATDISALSGDFRAGYLFDGGGLIYGVEGVLSPGPIAALRSYPNGAWLKFTLDHQVSIRAKAGLPLDRFMPYAALGIAVTDFAYENVPDGRASTIAVGAEAAIGVEWRAAERLSIGLEASAIAYQQVTWTYPMDGSWTVPGVAAPVRIAVLATYRF